MRNTEQIAVATVSTPGGQVSYDGDAAIDDVIHAFREAQRAFPREDARHRIEHCQMVRQDQLDAIAELGLSPSFFVGHVYYWGDRHRDIFMGPERAAGISALHSAIARGITFTVHDDTPVTPVDPLQLVWVSVNRMTRSNRVLGPEERISPHQALRAITIDAAWQNFEEEYKGSIAPGKLADFLVLDSNPLADPQTVETGRYLANSRLKISDGYIDLQILGLIRATPEKDFWDSTQNQHNIHRQRPVL